MKRVEILKKLAKAGFEFKEGGKHTKIYKDGIKVSALSRQSEIKEWVGREIEKQTGITLR